MEQRAIKIATEICKGKAVGGYSLTSVFERCNRSRLYTRAGELLDAHESGEARLTQRDKEAYIDIQKELFARNLRFIAIEAARIPAFCLEQAA